MGVMGPKRQKVAKALRRTRGDKGQRVKDRAHTVVGLVVGVRALEVERAGLGVELGGLIVEAGGGGTVQDLEHLLQTTNVGADGADTGVCVPKYAAVGAARVASFTGTPNLVIGASQNYRRIYTHRIHLGYL